MVTPRLVQGQTHDFSQKDDPMFSYIDEVQIFYSLPCFKLTHDSNLELNENAQLLPLKSFRPSHALLYVYMYTFTWPLLLAPSYIPNCLLLV